MTLDHLSLEPDRPVIWSGDMWTIWRVSDDRETVDLQHCMAGLDGGRADALAVPISEVTIAT